MKKLVLITGIILITCVCVSSFAGQSATALTEPAPVTEVNEGYVVREYNGCVAVFREGRSNPARITSTRTDTLPKSDIKKLREGIRVEDRQTLDKILEDYCS